MLNKLNSLETGESGIVAEIDNESNIKRRLLDIGLTNHTLIECIITSPFGDPKAYWIKGALIAIRNEDAENILIEKRGEIIE